MKSETETLRKNITIDTSILTKISWKEEVTWNQILDGFIEGHPITGWVTSAALQEFHKQKPYPERLKILDNLESKRQGYGSGLYGQGLYGGTTIHQAQIASSLFTVGLSEIGSGDCIASDENRTDLDNILHILTNGGYKGWDRQNLTDPQKRMYRDAQAFETHMRCNNDIFLTNDSNFNKLKEHYDTTILNLDEVFRTGYRRCLNTTNPLLDFPKTDFLHPLSFDLHLTNKRRLKWMMKK